MIKFNRVYKVYEKNIEALSDISFLIEKGEFVFLTGPSGAGKTTILRLLYRDETPDMGTIHVDGNDISHIHSSKVPYYRRGIGFVFQDFKLLFDRSVYENISLPLEITGSAPEYIKAAVAESIEKIGLKGKEKLNPWHLSGGEKQKVAIARAMILSPAILLADEPTGNLDEESSSDIMKMFQEANSKGTTVFMASHNKEVIARAGYRCIRLKGGKTDL
jgi:cell division transport system ATP-binding protein